VVDLGDLDPSDVDMRCLLLIGSSATRVVTRESGQPVVYTPRRYLT
jgi:precorrin-2 C20-methyltransferase/precorrin-3B C17-methyltransferase